MDALRMLRDSQSELVLNPEPATFLDENICEPRSLYPLIWSPCTLEMKYVHEDADRAVPSMLMHLPAIVSSVASLTCPRDISPPC